MNQNNEEYPLISVIVPIYKVEKYLDKCIECIVNQTYKNLEIILVDDGSPDKCPEMCEQWAQKDKRIKVIHKQNGGRSSARNAGLDIAKGKYIGFIDSDDTIKPDMYSKLYEIMIKNNTDISICGILAVNEKGEVLREVRLPDIVLDKQKLFDHLFFGESYPYSVNWNKLYKAEIWQKLRFAEGYIHEDDIISHRIFGECKNAALTSEMLYVQLWHDSSTMGKINSSKFSINSFKGRALAGIDKYDFFKKNGRDDLADMSLRYLTIPIKYAFSRVNYFQFRDLIKKPALFAAVNLMKSKNFGNKLRAVKVVLLWFRSMFRPYIKLDGENII